MADSPDGKPKIVGFASLFRPSIGAGTTILSGAEPDDGNIVAFAARRRPQPAPAELPPAWARRWRAEMLALVSGLAERGEGKGMTSRVSVAVQAMRQGYADLAGAGAIRPEMSIKSRHRLVLGSAPVRRYGETRRGLSYDTFVRAVLNAAWPGKPEL